MSSSENPPPRQTSFNLTTGEHNNYTEEYPPNYGGNKASSSIVPVNAEPARMKPMSLQPSFAHQIALPPTAHGCYEGILTTCGNIMGFFGIIPFTCCMNPYRTVYQGEVGLIAKFGKYYRSVDPGLHEINTWTEELRTVNIKLHIEDIPRQLIMTKDNVNISLDSVLYWAVVDPYVVSYLVEDVRTALIERTQTTLRHILGTRLLQECIENRNSIAHEIQQTIEPAAESWGVKIESILIKDLQFSQDLQENLSAAAKQKRLGEAKVIVAQAEVEAAKLMREASDILSTPAAMQLRYLETLTNMAKTSGSKVIFMPGSHSDAANSQKIPQFSENEAVKQMMGIESLGDH